MKLPHLALTYGKRLRPGRDWAVLLLIAFLGLVAVVGWNVWLFGKVASGSALGEAPRQAPAGLTQSTLAKLGDLFEERAAELTKYEDGTYHFVDPSK